MAAPGSISFTKDLHRRFYTAYRPIILQAYINDSDVAYVRGQLFVQTAPGSSFVSTGVLINAYEEPSHPNRYSMNIMEYCRAYISSGLCPLFSWNGFIVTPSYTESARFYVKCWPVRYSNTAVGQLVDDYNSEVDSKTTVVIAANTNESTSTESNGLFLHLDKYVLGQNGTVNTNHAVKPLTNTPFLSPPATLESQEQGGWNGMKTAMNDPNPNGWGIGIDMKDHWGPSFYYLNGVDKPDTNYCFVITRDFNGELANMSMFEVSYDINTASDMQRLLMHPVALENFISMQTGSAFNGIIDTNGNLIASGVIITMLNNPNWSGTGTNNYWGTTDGSGSGNFFRWQGVNYSDYKNGIGTCKLDDRVRLHWKNSLGGYDWFNFFGTQNKAVKVSGTRYEKFNEYGFRGLAGNTELWTKREDEFTVMSQPLNKLTAIWLEELIVSSKIWLEITIVDMPGRGQQNQLIPVNMVPGSYQVFNSEDNMHFIEIKYTLANARTQQRG